MKSFEPKLWITILTFLSFILPVTWNLFYSTQVNTKSSNIAFFEIFFAIFQNCVEQSTPYTKKLLKLQAFQILAGVTLLCLLVISNAYKNDNMYDLMNPKRFKPFQYVEQLCEANYSVFSLPSDMFITSSCNQNAAEFLACIKNETKDNHQIVVSGNHYERLRVTSQHVGKYHNTYFIRSVLPTKYEYLYNYSVLWQKPVQQLAKELKAKTLHYQNIFYDKHDFEDMDTEIAALQSLEDCNNTTFLQEDAKIQKWVLMLKLKGSTKISIGREVLIQKVISYSFRGWVPTFIQKRIGVMSSGILEW